MAHPNVVAVYDQGDDDGTLFLAMEYVAGRHTLRDLIRDEAPLAPRRALSLLEEILKAIAAAHESGIVHRDVKPENVLINPRGQIKVADFGLARAISSATTATATGGVLMGTVSYLPPELVTEGVADARSDVYSLGVLLFEMLTGRKPHLGESPIQIAYKHVHDDVPPPSAFVPDIPPYVDALVARATARQRDLRPADAHVMLQQLRRVRHAIDNNVIDDPELTEDLTPTIAIALDPEREFDVPPGIFEDVDPDEATDVVPTAAAAAAAATAAGHDPADEVFDFSRYDDFEHPGPDFLPANGSPDRTLVVGMPPQQPREHDTVESPASDPRRVGLHPNEPQAPGTYGGSGRPTGTPPRRPKRKKSGWIAFFVVLLLAAGAAMAGWWYGVGRFTSTPDVVSLSQDAAKEQIEDAGLTFKVGSSAYSEKVPAGRVVSTDPGPGDDVVRGGTVTATISKGPERHDVPNLEGKSESEAITAIRAASLTVAPPQRQWSESVKRGDVISFTPPAGKSVKADTPVHLVISKGPRPITIVDWTGKDADDARASLSEAGFEVTTTDEYNDDVAQGVVISQTPHSGSGHADDTIKLVVSKGPHLVEVPDVDLFGVDAAQQALEEAGFEVEVEHNQPYFGLGYVVGQSPGANDMAPYQSRVVVYIA